MDDLTPIPITRESFTRAMQEAVAERGADWTYPRHDRDWLVDGDALDDAELELGYGICAYALEDGSPACLIGLALAKLHHTLPEHDLEEGAANLLELRYGVTDGMLRRAAGVAQNAQDHSEDWGTALGAYINLLAGATE